MAKQLLIIGGGPAATHAAETIRQFDRDARVTLICDEPAHSRMALPYWLAGQIPQQQTFTGSADSFAQLNVTWRGGVRATQLNEPDRSVTLSDDSVIPFDELLLATGSTPNPLPIPGTDLPGVSHLWTLDDTQRVMDIAANCQRPRVVLIGAGFIGLIVLNAMHKRGWQLTVVERENQLLPRMLSATAAQLVHSWLRDRQVGLYRSTGVQSIAQAEGGDLRVRLDNGTQLPADLVIVATGVRPNLDLVRSTNIQTEEGILVNDQMQTSVAGIYAAGDVAQGPVLGSGLREVHAIQPTAVDHGRVAGANMAGRTVRYAGSLSMNVLDVCGLQCCSFGRWDDAQADAMTICNPASLIYRSLYWTDDRITGAIFVGRPHDMGMLTDVGMVKGLIQTSVRLGTWKHHLQNNPFDVRRAYVASRVPEQLAQMSLLGQPTADRCYRFAGTQAQHTPGAAHAVYVDRGD